jgi:hypothetical protein
MPEYDVVNYPKPMTDDLTDREVGRDDTKEPLKSWPSSNVLPEHYQGAVPSREFETIAARVITAAPVPPVAPPTETPDRGLDPLPGIVN